MGHFCLVRSLNFSCFAFQCLVSPVPPLCRGSHWVLLLWCRAFFSQWHFNINSQYSLPQRRLPSYCWPIKYQLRQADKGKGAVTQDRLRVSSLFPSRMKKNVIKTKRARDLETICVREARFRWILCLPIFSSGILQRAGGLHYFLLLFLIIHHHAFLRFRREGQSALN